MSSPYLLFKEFSKNLSISSVPLISSFFELISFSYSSKYFNFTSIYVYLTLFFIYCFSEPIFIISKHERGRNKTSFSSLNKLKDSISILVT